MGVRANRLRPENAPGRRCRQRRLTAPCASPRVRPISAGPASIARPALSSCRPVNKSVTRPPTVYRAVSPMSEPKPWSEPVATAKLVLDDGTVISGIGIGAAGTAVGEVCFNTAITGYQEILTDPVLCRPDHHLHASRTSATSAPTRKTARRRTSPRALACAAACCAPTSRSRRTIAPPSISTRG